MIMSLVWMLWGFIVPYRADSVLPLLIIPSALTIVGLHNNEHWGDVILFVLLKGIKFNSVKKHIKNITRFAFCSSFARFCAHCNFFMGKSKDETCYLKSENTSSPPEKTTFKVCVCELALLTNNWMQRAKYIKYIQYRYLMNLSLQLFCRWISTIVCSW